MSKKIHSDNLLSHKIYWLNKLSRELPETNLFLDYRRPLDYLPKDNSLSFELPSELSASILKLAKGSYFSTYWILLSALIILLQKYTRNKDIVIGTPVYKGIDSDCDKSRVIPLITQVTPQLSFKDLLSKVKDVIISAYNNQTCNFDELIRLLEISTSPNRSPIFDIVVLLENIHGESSLDGLSNDITIYFSVSNKVITGKLDYKNSLFDSKTIESFIKCYLSTLEHIIQDTEIKISEVNLLKDGDKQHLLKSFNSNSRKYPIEQTIERLFEQQVLHTPNNIAVVYRGNKLTYQQLNEKANQLARLLQQLGLSKGEFVGILKDRDLNFLIAILAIYKAGGAYVPIDSNYPLDRIAYMLSNSEVKYLFTDFSLLNTLEEVVPNCQQLSSLICLDDVISEPQLTGDLLGSKIYQKSDFSQFSSQNLEPIDDANDPAYMLYTSGSTGLPKGAIVRHDGAINHIYAQYDELELGEEFTFLQSAPSSTDISVWQFLAPLLIGGKTVIVDLETVAIAEKLFKILKSEKITVVELVPALFGGLLEYASSLPVQERELPDLKWMMVVGEPISVKRVNEWLSIYPHIKIADAYGPTEAADDITQFIVDRSFPENQRTVPIGKPLANLNLYILDEQMKLLPIGAPGEICVSGIGVGDGYWKNEEKTRQAFVPNPFIHQLASPQNHDVIYKTGDLGRWLSDGNIEFLGRIDNQVKIRGFRIELGEIEAVVRLHPAVSESVVVVREDDFNGKYIVAYFVSDRSLETEELIGQLRSLLKEKLPQHMIPSYLVAIAKIPLAPSGKVDRKALPGPDRTIKEQEFVPPRNPTEEIVADIWCQILKREKISIDDDFFDLGGHSLLATQVISRLREAFEIEFPLRSLFEHSTIAGLAQEIEKASEAGLGLEVPPIKRVERKTELPLSFAQQRLWFLSQLEPNSSSYNIPAAVRLKGKLNHNALEQSFNEIVRRHEVLRTNFRTGEGQAVAIISKVKSSTLPILDISSLSTDRQQAETKQQTSQEAQRPFDLSSDHLIRLKLFRLGEQEHIALLTMHHIISDAWSMEVLIEELAALYPAFCAGKPSPLSELNIQYTDFAVWQRQWLQGKVLQTQLDYWKQQLGSTYPRLTFPNLSKPSSVESNRGAKQSFTLSKDLTEEINLLSRQEGTTLFMTLLAVFQVLLYCFTGTEDIRVGSPIANRNRVEIEKLIGFFINTLVLRIDLSGNPSFRELLLRSRKVTLEAYANQDLPFEKLVEELQPERSLNRHPLYQAWFVLQNAPMPKLELPDITLTPFEVERDTVRHDLLLAIWESSEGLKGKFEYKTDLFHEASISRLTEHFKTLVQHIVAQPDTTLDEIATMLTQSDEEQQKTQKQELRFAERQKLKMIKRKTIRK